MGTRDGVSIATHHNPPHTSAWRSRTSKPPIFRHRHSTARIKHEGAQQDHHLKGDPAQQTMQWSSRSTKPSGEAKKTTIELNNGWNSTQRLRRREVFRRKRCDTARFRTPGTRSRLSRNWLGRFSFKVVILAREVSRTGHQTPIGGRSDMSACYSMGLP